MEGREWMMSLCSRMDEYVGVESNRSSDHDSKWKQWMIDRITAEAARRETALRKRMGEPKFKVGDKVWFKADGNVATSNEGLADEFKQPVATVAIVDATGTFEQQDEPSYDLVSVKKDEGFVATATTALQPELTFTQTTGFKVECVTPAVTDKEIEDDSIESRIESILRHP